VQFGRRPQDIAFAAGDRAIFLELHNASTKAAPPEAPSDLPDPADFWKYIEKAGTGTGAGGGGGGSQGGAQGGTGGGWGQDEEGVLRPPERSGPGGPPRAQAPKSDNPRENFERCATKRSLVCVT
jgi:hypothetical protein